MDALVQQMVAAAKLAGYDPALLVAQAWVESALNPQAHNPRSGASGLFQFLPATAKQYQVDVTDAESSTQGAIRYMQELIYKFGAKDKALAAYNWGQGNLSQLLRQHPADWKKRLPAETRNYLKILDLAAFAEHLL